MRPLLLLSVVAPLAGCFDLGIGMETPTVASVNGIPFTNYRCSDFSLVQVAYDEQAAIVRLGGQNYTVRYSESDVGVVYVGEALALTIDDEDIFVSPRAAGGNAAVAQVAGRRCSYESGG